MEPRQESGLPAGVDSGASYASASASASASTKRKRSRSHSPPPANPRSSSSSSKTRHEAAHIDYLSRSLEEDVPLISGEENCTTMNRYIDGYEAVLQHHESLAANMGGKPLGQTLMKRFDRLWDGPVKVLYSQKEGNRSVSWLDVVDHYRNKPRDFNLLENRHGMRMCHVWIRSCKVEVLEEDFSLIKSGMPQKMIPPQPLAEDEEQELGTLDLLESRLLNVISQVDGVSGRARSLNHRLRARRAAIIASHGRSAPLGSNGTVHVTESKSSASQRDPVTATHALPSNALNGHPSTPMSSTSATTGFVAVNTARASGPVATGKHPDRDTDPARKVHADLLRRFSSQAPPTPSHKTSQHTVASSSKLSTPRPSSAAHTHIPHPHSAPSHKSGSTQAKPTLHGAAYTSHQSSLASISVHEDGPYKAIMLAKMEHMNKGDPVTPPCDRCRRLGMGCARNLTACMGCTRKHAKCTWLDVREGELIENGTSVPTALAAIESEPIPVHGSGRDLTVEGDDVVGRLGEERDREHERRLEKEDRRRERERERELDPTAEEQRENQKRARREQMERVRQREWREEVELEALRLERRFEAEARQRQKSRLERERDGERRTDRVLIPAEPQKKRELEKEAAHAFRGGEKELREEWKVDKTVEREEEIAKEGKEGKEGKEEKGKEKDGESDGGAPTRDSHRREEEDEPMES